MLQIRSVILAVLAGLTLSACAATQASQDYTPPKKRLDAKTTLEGGY